MKDLLIVSATKEENKYKTLISDSVGRYETIYNYTINSEIITRNTSSLATIYNKYLIEQNRDKIIVYVHDDCLIEDLFLVEKLNKAMEQSDIIGLAGIKDPITIKEPALWHLMGDRSQWSGAVAHFTSKDDVERFMTPFGSTPARVILLDGVFLAVNVEKCLENNVRFDESNPARFHYYDLDFCLNANKAGLKLTTYPIFCSHKSHGLTKPDEEFYKGQEWFIKKWT